MSIVILPVPNAKASSVFIFRGCRAPDRKEAQVRKERASGASGLGVVLGIAPQLRPKPLRAEGI